MRRVKKSTNKYLTVASILFALFLLDVLAAKFQVMSGNTTPIHIGDTAQFLLLLLAVVLFVMGTLSEEARD